MEIILREDVENLGDAGEIVRVKPGYARNFLLPKGLAYPATEGNKKRVAQEAAAIADRRQKVKADAEEAARGLEGVTVTFRVKVGDEDKLYGSITSSDIQRELEALGHHVDKRRIELSEPIRELGDFSVAIRLHAEVKPAIAVRVERE